MAVEVQSVITMANSIIGVSVLAMPFCFKQCGIILATLMILMSGYLVKMTCHLLVKSSIIARRRNYEVLAFETFGGPGKMAVEMSMIGFMVGTCIAFFVVIGDLAPPIIATLIDVVPSENLRILVLFGICIFIVLPLTMLRNLDSLFAFSTASILFYCFVMLHIIFSSRSNIFDGSWTKDINWWRPAGIFQCLPIFCMALSCQCQVFEIYESLPEPSLGHMNEVVRGAVNICSGVYFAVGLFGNIACSGHDLGGNILTALPPSGLVEFVKIGFVLSVAVSFPLVIFPCRTSIHSLIFRKGSSSSHSEIISNFIPPLRFNVITVVVVLVTLIMGIMLPDIEFVLGIVGSTIGNVICIIFPAIIFIKLTSKNTTERLAAQAIFFLGLLLMVLGTYVNLYEADSKAASKPDIDILALPVQNQAHPSNLDHVQQEMPRVKVDEPAIVGGKAAFEKLQVNDKERLAQEKKEDNEAKRQEPIEPVPPKDDSIVDINKVDDGGGGKLDQNADAEQKLIKYKTVGLNVDKLVEKDNNIEDKLKEKEEKAEKLIEELEKQKQEQKQILFEQKQVLQEMRQHVVEDKMVLQQQQQQQQQNNQQPVIEQQQPQIQAVEVPQQPIVPQQDQVVPQLLQEHLYVPLAPQPVFVNHNEAALPLQQLQENMLQQRQPNVIPGQVPFEQHPPYQPQQQVLQAEQQPYQQGLQYELQQQPHQQQQLPVIEQQLQLGKNQQALEQQQPFENQQQPQQPIDNILTHQQQLLLAQQQILLEQQQEEQNNQPDPSNKVENENLAEPSQNLDDSPISDHETRDKKEMKRDVEHIFEEQHSSETGVQSPDCLNCAPKINSVKLSQIV